MVVKQRPYWKIIDDCEYFIAQCSKCKKVVDSRSLPHKCPYCKERMDKESYKKSC